MKNPPRKKAVAPPRKKLAELSELTSFEDAQKEVFAKFPRVRKLWEQTAPRRKISLVLVGLRKQAGLSQKEVAARARWDKAFVSRLESATGGVPDAETVARYAAACGATAGVVIGVQSDPTHMKIIDAITLQSALDENGAGPFELLQAQNLKLKATDAG